MIPEESSLTNNGSANCIEIFMSFNFYISGSHYLVCELSVTVNFLYHSLLMGEPLRASHNRRILFENPQSAHCS